VAVTTAAKSTLRRVFANQVRRRRKGLGISQEELARRADVHRTFVSELERGVSNISIDNIARISAALEVPAWELLRSE
jgi:transcriptional regulator with XRE-family HTH domain